MTSIYSKTSDPTSSLSRLERWYKSMCNGDWEHTYGVKIETLDNPGWMLTVEVRDTPLFEAPFAAIREDRTEAEWIQCEVVDGIFLGTGGLGSLEQILKIFLDWAEDNG